MLLRLGVLLSCALACLLTVPAGPALAAPTPCVGLLCPTPSPTTPPPTSTATPSPTRTASPRPTSTRTRTSSPRPHVTRSKNPLPAVTTPPSETGAPETAAPSSSASPVKVAPTGTTPKSSGRVDSAVALILGGAVLLGIGGVSGLYLTRERDER